MTNEPRSPANRVWTIVRAVGSKFVSDNGFFLSSALAFNLLLYFIPLALLMVSFLGYTVLDSDRAMREVQSVLLGFFPRSEKMLTENIAAIVAYRGSLGVAGFASFLLLSTFLFGSVRTVLNCVFEVQRARSFVHGFWVDVLMMGAMAVLLLFAAGAEWFLAVAEAFAHRFSMWRPLVEPGFDVVSKLVSASATTCLLYGLYRFAPATGISSRALLIASVSGTGLFQLAKWSFSFYVDVAQRNIELYGAFAGLILLVSWLYYASAVFVIGAEIGWVYDQERASGDHLQSHA